MKSNQAFAIGTHLKNLEERLKKVELELKTLKRKQSSTKLSSMFKLKNKIAAK